MCDGQKCRKWYASWSLLASNLDLFQDIFLDIFGTSMLQVSQQEKTTAKETKRGCQKVPSRPKIATRLGKTFLHLKLLRLANIVDWSKRAGFPLSLCVTLFIMRRWIVVCLILLRALKTYGLARNDHCRCWTVRAICFVVWKQAWKKDIIQLVYVRFLICIWSQSSSLWS